MNTSRFRRTFIVLFLMGLVSFGAATKTNAGGFLLIGGVYRQPLSSHVNIDIKEKIATTVLEQTFHNNLDKEVAAIYVAPVPPDATVTGFAELVDGRWFEATIKGSDKAQQDFATAVKNGQDAAVASNATMQPSAPGVTPPPSSFQIQVSLPPNVNRSVRLSYTQVLTGEVGLTRYTMPLSDSHLTDEKIGDLLVSVNISDTNEIRAVYSPSYKDAIEVARSDKNSAKVTYRAQNVSPAQDFDLIYTESSDKFGVNVASYRANADEDGFFVLVASPQLEAQSNEVIQKDFVFVLDCSGSMKGQKIVQAKAALANMINNLNAGDRFTVIDFESKVQLYSQEMQPLDMRPDALTWVDRNCFMNGTNINASLLTALSTADKSKPQRPHIIVFLTDGQPTEGVTDIQAIIQNVRQTNQGVSRIYTIGIGDVNQSLLTGLAQENRGSALFVTDRQDLTKPLRDFHASINNPVLIDLALDFGSADVYDVYPKKIPDMFLGGQVIITGRYRKGGITDVKLNGSINGQPYSAVYKAINFNDNPDESKSYSFVSRLWAQRKVDTLLTKLQNEGDDPATREEVRQLGLQYNIITPYTSFVALPKGGLPFLYADDYRTTNTILITLGISLMGLGTVMAVVKYVAVRRGHA